VDVSMKVLLSFLYMKKIRNFNEHSDFWDFIMDSRSSGQCEFKNLLERRQIDEVMEQYEIDVLKKIFTKYYSDTMNVV